MIQPCAVVLAAGTSTRMGTCKATLPWLEGQTLLAYQLHQLLQAGFAPTVVLGPHNAHHQELCPPEVQVVFNPTPETGKTSSILIGLAALPTDLPTLLLSAVDQPRPASIYQTLLAAHSKAAPITIPTYQGKFGHPVLFAREILPALKAIQESSQGLRQVLRDFAQQIQPVAFDSATVLMDLNTPERYQEAIIRQGILPCPSSFSQP